MMLKASTRIGSAATRLSAGGGRCLPLCPSVAARVPSAAPRVAVRAAASSADAPQQEQQAARPGAVPNIPLYRDMQFSEAISKAQGFLQDMNAFKFVLNVEGQARNAMLLLQNLVQAQKAQSNQLVEMRMFSLRTPPEVMEQQKQQRQQSGPGTFFYRHVLSFSMAEPRGPTPEKSIRIPKQANFREKADQALEILKEEALKPNSVPCVALVCIGLEANLQTFKTLHALRLKLRGIDRGMVVQLEENKSMIEDREVTGLRYNVYLETLPAARAQQGQEQGQEQ